MMEVSARLGSGWIRWLRTLALVALGVLLAAAIIDWSPAPFAVLALTAAAAAALIARAQSAGSGWRALWFNLVVFLVLVGGLELWATRSVARRRDNSPTYNPNTYHRDSILGVAPQPNSVVHSVRQFGDSVVFRATYTFDGNALRTTPQPPAREDARCVLFFGDSFMLGEGLQDDQPIPAQVAAMGQGRYQVYNFGFHGYGPHQMLSALEHGKVDASIHCRPDYVVYASIEDHVARVAGLNAFARTHPRYRLQPDGSVRFAGQYGDHVAPPSPLMAQILEQLRKSGLYILLTGRHRPTNAEDLRLYTGVVHQSFEEVERRYPGCRFVVLIWTNTLTDQDSALRSVGLTPHVVEEILPHFYQDSARYTIPIDGHPSRVTDSLLARYLVDSILVDPAR